MKVNLNIGGRMKLCSSQPILLIISRDFPGLLDFYGKSFSFEYLENSFIIIAADHMVIEKQYDNLGFLQFFDFVLSKKKNSPTN